MVNLREAVTHIKGKVEELQSSLSNAIQEAKDLEKQQQQQQEVQLQVQQQQQRNNVSIVPCAPRPPPLQQQHLQGLATMGALTMTARQATATKRLPWPQSTLHRPKVPSTDGPSMHMERRPITGSGGAATAAPTAAASSSSALTSVDSTADDDINIIDLVRDVAADSGAVDLSSATTTTTTM